MMRAKKMFRMAAMNISMSTKKTVYELLEFRLSVFVFGNCHSIISILFYEVFKHHRGMH